MIQINQSSKEKNLEHKTVSLKRNFIWSLKENKLFNLNTDYRGPFFSLIFPAGWIEKELKNLALLGNSVQDTLLGDGLGSINFFPDQKVHSTGHPKNLAIKKMSIEFNCN